MGQSAITIMQDEGTNMSRKIAILGNGWSDEYLLSSLEGIKRGAEEFDCEIHFFVEYASHDSLNDSMQGEINILNLPDMKQYDGVILMGNTLMNAGELTLVQDRIMSSGVPTVCLEYEIDGIDCICTENYSGMYELCKHMVEEHGVKRVVFVSGIDGNVENADRKRALEQVLHEHNLSLAPEDIIYGDWSYYAVQMKLPEWLQNHELPDAFICANDVMALGVTTYLTHNGYSVPEDVSVTGFDNLSSTKCYVPAITTVERGWSDSGYEGLKHLMDLIEGGPSTGAVFHPSHPVIRESCGCRETGAIRKEQLASVNQIYNVPIERTLFDWHLTGLDDSMTGRLSLEDIHDGLQEFFASSETHYEGDTFCICLDDDFVNSIFENTEPRYQGYGERMHVLYAQRDGKAMPYQKINTSYIFPIMSEPSEKGNIYFIAPIHSQSANIGYVVFKNTFKVLQTFFIYSWVRHLRIGLLRCRENIIMSNLNKQLEEYSILDELSGLYNRKGLVTKGIPLLEKAKQNGKHALLMMVDIDKMKIINDRYGHLQGDLAIRLVAQAIKASISETWCGIRYGGDEFLIIGEKHYADEEGVLKRKICRTVKNEAEALKIPFELTVSVGSVQIDPTKDMGLDEYFQIADTAMYDMKKKAQERNLTET